MGIKEMLEKLAESHPEIRDMLNIADEAKPEFDSCMKLVEDSLVKQVVHIITRAKEVYSGQKLKPSHVLEAVDMMRELYLKCLGDKRTAMSVFDRVILELEGSGKI